MGVRYGLPHSCIYACVCCGLSLSSVLPILLYGTDMTDGSISPGNRGFKEIREWIDENGREVGSEVNDVGEILNRAEKLADEKRDKEKGESKWKQQPMNGDIVEPLGEKLASSSGEREARRKKS